MISFMLSAFVAMSFASNQPVYVKDLGLKLDPPKKKYAIDSAAAKKPFLKTCGGENYTSEAEYQGCLRREKAALLSPTLDGVKAPNVDAPYPTKSNP